VGDIEPMNYSNEIVQRMLDELHEFNPTYWPYTLKVETHDMHSAERFCYQHFKTKNWRNRGTKFAFKRKEDYEWFVLRWS
jgi:hypothetical protein